MVLRSSRLALAATLTLVLSQSALAGPVEEAKRHYAEGTKAYEIGAYDEAIKEYGEAYRLIDDPALLYNLGQAHRLAGHTIEALRAYRMFLLKVPDSPYRGEVEERIGDLQRQSSQPRSLPPTPSEAKAPPVEAPPVEAPPPSASPSLAPPAPAIDPLATAAARKKLIAGGVVTGAGVAIAVGGIVCGVLAQNAGNSITHAAQSGQAFDYSTFQAGKTDQALEIALLAVGGAAVIAGVTVMIVGKRQSSRAHASLHPFIGGRAGGFAVAGAF